MTVSSRMRHVEIDRIFCPEISFYLTAIRRKEWGMSA
jgi:hypothetical protein